MRVVNNAFESDLFRQVGKTMSYPRASKVFFLILVMHFDLIWCFQTMPNSCMKLRQHMKHHDQGNSKRQMSETYSTITKTSIDPTGAESTTIAGFGKWEELHGNYILRPSVADGPPRALVHFLGGALVGAAPHVSYRFMLEKLAENGYLVVATPYNLSFDHLETCDAIIHRFERIAPMLARTYGALPVVGVGHSLGSLLQLLITSLFPDTPRAANALLSFNNKQVNEAVPLFEEVFAPFFTFVAQKNGTLPSGSDTISLGLRLAKAASQGVLPSDKEVSEILNLMQPKIFNAAGTKDDNVKIPEEFREAFDSIAGPTRNTLSNAGLLPIMGNVIETLEQIPLLIEEVADGARDFTPTPDDVKAAARRAYRARRTLILQYSEDTIDESDEIEELLKEAERIIRMKRPMVEIDVQKRQLSGGHAAPLIAPPLDIASQAEDILGADTAKDTLLYSDATSTVEELILWLEEGNL